MNVPAYLTQWIQVGVWSRIEADVQTGQFLGSVVVGESRNCEEVVL